MHKISVLKYSAFDLANQWPHIFNYYRRIGIYKDLKDELNYAYFYNLIFNFLLLIKHFNNQQLYRKALRFVDTKLAHRLEDFRTRDKVFKLTKDEEFIQIINNFPNFIKTELKNNR
jgi:exonuclease I